jgi:hypothetical protein
MAIKRYPPNLRLRQVRDHELRMFRPTLARALTPLVLRRDPHHSGVTENMVKSWEIGEAHPRGPVLDALCELTGHTPEQLGVPERGPAVSDVPSALVAGLSIPAQATACDPLIAPAGPPMRLDESYVETVRSRIGELINMDIHFGGDQSSVIALRLFRSVHRKLGVSVCTPEVERELYAAAAELAEVTGWLLYDAAQHELVSQVNHEALHLCRMAGDTSMELLVLQNMAMHAGDLGRPREALRVARLVLETRTLSPRLTALFRIREARALAQLGDETAARSALKEATSHYLNGVRDDDPAWAWWVNDQELGWHQATIEADSGVWPAAVDHFLSSIELTPPDEVRREYNHLASLLNAQVHARAWHDAERTIERIAPYVDEVGSTRTATTLRGVIADLDNARPTAATKDAAHHLHNLLTQAGYGD